MASTTILYLRHDPFEHAALKEAVLTAKEVESHAVQTNENNPCEANKREVQNAARHAIMLANLLARYEGSLVAVGK
jgi:hypothetical protein